MKYKFKHNYIKLLALPLALSIAGCVSLTPQYSQPSKIIPTELPSNGIYSKNTNDPITQKQLHWSHYVSHKNLKTVLDISLKNNKDLKIAATNISAAKAQYGISKSELLPTINGGLNATKNRDVLGTNEAYQANLGISSFEIDTFGRLNSLNSAALELFLSTEEAKKATELTVISETLKAYFNIANAQSQLKIAENTEKSTLESLQIIRERVKYGISSAKDLSDVESTYYLAQSDVFSYKTQVEQNINALNALVGTIIDNQLLPQSIYELKDSILDINIPIESDILYKRPDILAAEHQLLSANANIGAARASFFPRISLTTSAGIISGELSSLLNSGTKAWSIAPSISIPIFDYGKNQANLKYSEAQKEKYIATYEKAVQTSFKEVADTLARKSTIDEQITAYQKYVNANKTSFNLATQLYDAGVKDYLTVLTAQNNLYNAEKSALSLYKEKFENKITLYKVIGY